ncbi:MAG: glycoside hydrolase 43 family protein [Verrucomicrobiota bacterium]|nr:glycoside hydrolase 43 family protein [Limisphaera sp.]MDW8382605.1 glycoside hydrolase 43 family protein [Verrucomicrobiota bacterium]
MDRAAGLFSGLSNGLVSPMNERMNWRLRSRGVSGITGVICCLGVLGHGAVRAAHNPILWADVPDLAMVRVGNTYYMSSTTMHMSPGVPIMKSTDLVNWTIVNYAYDILEDVDELNLERGKSDYGRGSWASSIRYHQGRFYVSTFCHTTRKTYIYWTTNVETGPWESRSFQPALHDHSLFFDDDGRVYMLYGVGNLWLAELNEDLSGLKEGGIHQVVISNAHAVVTLDVGLPAEGSQLFKYNGKYYLFNICWPRGGMRTVVIHRADRLTGPWEGRLGLQDKGVAQGSLIDTPDGRWYAYLFRDWGAVGRVPYLVPVRWEAGWPVLGIDGKVPDELPDLPTSRGLIPGTVASDEFDRKPGDRPLPLVWQWNHNPDSRFWSISARPGYLRLIGGRVDREFEQVRNMLTQRTFGPECSGWVTLDVSHLKDGDCAGLALLQRHYGYVAVRQEGATRWIVMVNRSGSKPVEVERIPLEQTVVHLRAECDFRDLVDTGWFSYSLDGRTWRRVGNTLRMQYTIPHFMGYRFALFHWATREPGGWSDFDSFRVSTKTSGPAGL